MGAYPMMQMASPAGTPTSSGHVQPTKLFIGGISRRTTTKQLRDHFSQSGRVLDCVAMRTPDGRPRGFGYVTLDSPAAADRFLAEPQMIDDRFVDMKRAVPEALTPKESSGQYLGARPDLLGATGMMDHSMSMQAFYSQPGMCYPWPDHSGFYADSGFGGCVLPDVGMQPSMVGDPAMDCVDLLSHAATGPLLLDCVDLLTGSLLAGFGFPTHQENLMESQEPLGTQPIQVPVVSKSTTSTKAPLGEVTNLVCNSQILSTKSISPPTPAKYDVTKPYKPTRIEVMTPFSSPTEPCFIYEDPQVDDAVSPAGASTEPPSPAGQDDLSPQAPSMLDDLSPQAPSVATPAEIEAEADACAEGLPSLGSAQHAAGECRRCNFFAKGRCRNGLDCVFCHLPHDRRKLSRQEKREQQAARQATLQQDGAASDDGSDSASASEAEVVMPKPCGLLLSPHSLSRVTPEELLQAGDDEVSTKCGLLLSPAGARVPPGLLLGPAEQSQEVPAPDAAVAKAALPPGLRPPGLPTPVQAAQAAQATGQLCQARPAPLGRLFPWEASGAGFLSTSPCSSVGGSTFLLSTSPTSTATKLPEATSKTIVKETRTVETQTDNDFPCPYCEDCGETSTLSNSCECPAGKEASSKRSRRRNGATSIPAAAATAGA